MALVEIILDLGIFARGDGAAKVHSTFDAAWSELDATLECGQDTKVTAGESAIFFNWLAGTGLDFGAQEAPQPVRDPIPPGGTITKVKLHVDSFRLPDALTGQFRIGLVERDGLWDGTSTGFGTASYPKNFDLPHMTDEDSDAVIAGRIQDDTPVGVSVDWDLLDVDKNFDPTTDNGFGVGIWSIGDADYSPEFSLGAGVFAAAIDKWRARSPNQTDGRLAFVLDPFALPSNGTAESVEFHAFGGAGSPAELFITYDEGVPSITSTAPTAACEGALYRYDATATDPASLQVAADTDLRWTLQTDFGNASIDSLTGEFRWLPLQSDVGVARTFKIRVTDTDGFTDEQTFILTAVRSGRVMAKVGHCIDSAGRRQVINAVTARGNTVRHVSATQANIRRVSATQRMVRLQDAQPPDRFSQLHMEPLLISGVGGTDDLRNGIFDPAVFYPLPGSPGVGSALTGYLTYGAATGSQPAGAEFVHTDIAQSTDQGRTWSFLVRAIESHASSDVGWDPPAGQSAGFWHMETPTLVYQPLHSDADQRWACYSFRIWHDGTKNQPLWSWLVRSTAPDPSGPWTEADDFIGTDNVPAGPWDPFTHDLALLDPELATYTDEDGVEQPFIAFSEPAWTFAGFGTPHYLLLSGLGLTGAQAQFLLETTDHGVTFTYIGKVLTRADAALFGHNTFDGCSIYFDGGDHYLTANRVQDPPPRPDGVTFGNFGSVVFKFDSLAAGTLVRDADGKPTIFETIGLAPNAGIDSTTFGGGQAGYDMSNRAGGFLFSQQDLANARKGGHFARIMQSRINFP